MYKAILPQEYLKTLFDFSPETGSLIWRVRPISHFKTPRAFKSWHTKYAGKEAGSLGLSGYLQVAINDNLFKAHRIIYKLLYNEEPEQIDHINHIRHDNRPVNLRAATRQENSKNRNMQSNNTSGITGVDWNKPTGKWRARIDVGGKKINLGLFADIEDAAEVRNAAEIKCEFHKNHGRK